MGGAGNWRRTPKPPGRTRRDCARPVRGAMLRPGVRFLVETSEGGVLSVTDAEHLDEARDGRLEPAFRAPA